MVGLREGLGGPALRSDIEIFGLGLGGVFTSSGAGGVTVMRSEGDTVPPDCSVLGRLRRRFARLRSPSLIGVDGSRGGRYS